MEKIPTEKRGLLAEEQPPGIQPDFQAIKAFLTFGGSQIYYLVSVRHHILGDDLATTFTRVADELHHQYALGFAPATLDGKVHTLAVRVRPNGATVRARKNYLAASTAQYSTERSRRSTISGPPAAAGTAF